MSMLVSCEPLLQDVIETARGLPKCRIPQRLPSSGRARPPCTSIFRARDTIKPKYEGTTPQNSRFAQKNVSRPRSDDSRSRPKSANRLKEELFGNRQHLPRSGRPNERLPHVLKRPSMLTRKTNENQKGPKPVITVPMTQRPPVKNTKNMYCPQETRKDADLELHSSEVFPDYNQMSPEQITDKESLTSQSEQLMQLKIIWQDKVVQFEKMKNDLDNRQKNILEVYAMMRDTQQKMASLGERTPNMPPPEDLRIMNVSKMTPEMLLQLCSGDVDHLKDKHQCEGKTALTIDIAKLYETPTKLIETCERALTKRKEIINWFESITSTEKGISVHKLSKKINEFNGENDMLRCSLDQVKAEFMKELEEIINLLRKGINETMALHLRTEELTYEVTELNSQNSDLRKQIHNTDHIRSHTNKARVIEELERELKDEKCKRVFLRDRLSRSDGLVKNSAERTAQLEATLEEARSQIWSLERTVQQLRDQNQKLQNDFDEELNKLTESIKEHTLQLEEISDAREKLQAEKDDLEKRLTELSVYYNESISNTTHEMNVNVGKLVETEKKYQEQIDNNNRLEGKLESLCTQLLQTEQRYKETLQKLQEMETQLIKGVEAQEELVSTRHELEKAYLEINDNRNRLLNQNETIKKREGSLKEALDFAESLKRELSIKIECIEELEKKQIFLEQQAQENENKMETYVEQLSALKIHITQLQEDFGDIENLNELHEMVNQQREKLIEAAHQNSELAEALQEKTKELEQYTESLSEHEQMLLEKEGVIKMLSEKEEEQNNIIKLLRNNLELTSRAGNELSQQLMEKNTEIDSLVVNLETRKQQISNMERIILTLEDQTRKASFLRKKDKDHIIMLQNKISEYESLQMDVPRTTDSPAENLDSLIKILEDELGSPIDQNAVSKKKDLGERMRDKLDYLEDNNSQSRYQSEPEQFPTKIVMGNFIKKTYIPTNDNQYLRDNLDRKKAITSIDTQKWIPAPEPSLNKPLTSAKKDSLSNFRRHVLNGTQNTFLSRNLQNLSSDQRDKKYKMFKLAGHRL